MELHERAPALVNLFRSPGSSSRAPRNLLRHDPLRSIQRRYLSGFLVSLCPATCTIRARTALLRRWPPGGRVRDKLLELESESDESKPLLLDLSELDEERRRKYVAWENGTVYWSNILSRSIQCVQSGDRKSVLEDSFGILEKNEIRRVEYDCDYS